MTPELWVTLAVATISAVGGIVASILSIANHGKLDKLEVSINGRLTQLLKVNDQAARAEGVMAGSIDRDAITAALAKAMGDAAALPPPAPLTEAGLAGAIVLSKDTNERVRSIQDDAAAVAAALIVKNAAAIAAALVVKTAEDAAQLAHLPHPPTV